MRASAKSSGIIMARQHDPSKFDADGNLKMAPMEIFIKCTTQRQLIHALARWAFPDCIMNQDAAYCIPGNEDGHNGYSTGTTTFGYMWKRDYPPLLVSVGEYRVTRKDKQTGDQRGVGELFTIPELIPGRPKPKGVLF